MTDVPVLPSVEFDVIRVAGVSIGSVFRDPRLGDLFILRRTAELTWALLGIVDRLAADHPARTAIELHFTVGQARTVARPLLPDLAAFAVAVEVEARRCLAHQPHPDTVNITADLKDYPRGRQDAPTDSARLAPPTPAVVAPISAAFRSGSIEVTGGQVGSALSGCLPAPHPMGLSLLRSR